MSDHTTAPIQADLRLDDLIVEALSVRTNLTPPSASLHGDQPLQIDVSVDILRSGDQPRFMVPLKVRMNHGKEAFKNSGYSLDISVVGFFSFDDGLSEDHISHLIQLNAPAILYGVVRGLVAQALAMTNVGKVILPSINFVEVMRTRAARSRGVKGQVRRTVASREDGSPEGHAPATQGTHPLEGNRRKAAQRGKAQ